jgi:hypothetical protein
VNESGNIELIWGLIIDHKMVAVHGTLCTIALRNSNQNNLSLYFSFIALVTPKYF